MTAEAILAWLDEKPTLGRYASAARRLDELDADAVTPMRVLVIRTFTVEPLEPLLKVAAWRAGLRLELRYSGYDPWAEGAPATSAAADAVLVLTRLEDVAPALALEVPADPAGAVELADAVVDRVVDLARRVRAASPAGLVVSNFVPPRHLPGGLRDTQDPAAQPSLTRRMNLELLDRIREVPGCHVLDLDHVLSRAGLDAGAHAANDRAAGAPLSTVGLRAVADAAARHLRALAGPRAKCVVVDGDNTLWAGIVGEDGVHGVDIGATAAGRPHAELQHELRNLRRRGVLLALCSKNEEADVLAVLRSHPDSVLHEDDFAATRVNWADKATNVEEIADELNLALSHLVFVDDNPVECEWVKARLPEVHVVNWPADVGGGRLDDLGLFDTFELTEEDRGRTEMVRADVSRRRAKEGVVSIEEYLRSLEMVATVGRARPEHLPRLAQLTQRTNQFNLTTRRYEVQDLERFASSDDAGVLWLDLQDRFGGNGTVGCAIVERDGAIARIDTLLLSCRVLGRQVENVLVNRAAALALAMGAEQLVGEYVPTGRNAQVADLYGRLGFALASGDREGASTWRWDLAGGLPAVPDWFTVADADRAVAGIDGGGVA